MLFYPPGTVAAVNSLVKLFSEEGDEVIVHTPAYPPLVNIVEQNIHPGVSLTRPSYTKGSRAVSSPNAPGTVPAGPAGYCPPQ